MWDPLETWRPVWDPLETWPMEVLPTNRQHLGHTTTNYIFNKPIKYICGCKQYSLAMAK